MKTFWRAVPALLLVLVASAPAQAADPARVYNRVASADDPVATYQSLTKDQKAAFAKYVDVATVKTTTTKTQVQALAAASTCWQGGYARGAYNAFGNLLWTWNMYGEWCGDGERITYNYSRVYGITYIAFWSWRTVDKHQSMNTIASPDRLTVFGQAEFKVCVFADIGCVQYSYPWIEGRFYGNGAQAWRGGN